MWAMHRGALERSTPQRPRVGVLPQAWRGGPQPLLARLLDGCAIEPLDEPGARVAGQPGAGSVVAAPRVAGRPAHPLASAAQGARDGLVTTLERIDQLRVLR